MTKFEYDGDTKVSVESDRVGRKLNIRIGGDSLSVDFNVSYDAANKLFNKFWREYPGAPKKEEDMGNEPFEMGSATPIRESGNGKSILFDVEGEHIWIPKKVIHDDSEVWETDQEEGTLMVKFWWAEKEGHA